MELFSVQKNRQEGERERGRERRNFDRSAIPQDGEEEKEASFGLIAWINNRTISRVPPPPRERKGQVNLAAVLKAKAWTTLTKGPRPVEQVEQRMTSRIVHVVLLQKHKECALQWEESQCPVAGDSIT
jgi:hypothetical protein